MILKLSQYIYLLLFNLNYGYLWALTKNNQNIISKT